MVSDIYTLCCVATNELMPGKNIILFNNYILKMQPTLSVSWRRNFQQFQGAFKTFEDTLLQQQWNTKELRKPRIFRHSSMPAWVLLPTAKQPKFASGWATLSRCVWRAYICRGLPVQTRKNTLQARPRTHKCNCAAKSLRREAGFCEVDVKHFNFSGYQYFKIRGPVVQPVPNPQNN